ncbi:MAG: Gx transporter family protein [Clostridia bacterium]|nr:Gx transporter family protein [Clostridia bacterium]
MKNKITTKRIGLTAIFVSLGLVLQYTENRILITPIPGGKLGLANIVSILNIFMLGGKNALLVAVVRAFLGGLLTGGAMTVPYSMAGAIASVLIMYFFKRLFYPKMSMVGMGMIGAVFHNLAQLVVAALMYGSVYVFSYLPFLLILSLVSGATTGCAAQIFSGRIFKAEKGIN